MATACHLCNQNESAYRCPQCARMICHDCAGNGGCIKCNPLPTPPIAAQSEPVAQENLPASAGGALVGLMTGFLGLIVGLIIAGITTNARARRFGVDMAIGGAISGVGITLVWIINFLTYAPPVR